MIEGLFSSAFDGFPVVDDLLVDLAETKLGKRLPSSYVDLLRQQNGGYLRRNAFPTAVQNHSATGYVPVDYIAGVSRNEESMYGILITPYMIAEWDLPTQLILLCGDGHTWVALDYRDRPVEPGVTFRDLEMGQEIRLAETFETFVGNLTEGAG